MEKKLEKRLEVSVSYVYDPVKKTLDCDVMCGGLGDSFCCLFDDHPTHKSCLEFINGFILFLQEKQQQQQ